MGFERQRRGTLELTDPCEAHPQYVASLDSEKRLSFGAIEKGSDEVREIAIFSRMEDCERVAEALCMLAHQEYNADGEGIRVDIPTERMRRRHDGVGCVIMYRDRDRIEAGEADAVSVEVRFLESGYQGSAKARLEALKIIKSAVDAALIDTNKEIN